MVVHKSLTEEFGHHLEVLMEEDYRKSQTLGLPYSLLMWIVAIARPSHAEVLPLSEYSCA